MLEIGGGGEIGWCSSPLFCKNIYIIQYFEKKLLDYLGVC